MFTQQKLRCDLYHLAMLYIGWLVDDQHWLGIVLHMEKFNLSTAVVPQISTFLFMVLLYSLFVCVCVCVCTMYMCALYGCVHMYAYACVGIYRHT